VTQKIIDATIELEDDGNHYITVVDYLSDSTEKQQLPDHVVGMLPMVLGQLRKQLGTG
jgi:hypothetical protein